MLNYQVNQHPLHILIIVLHRDDHRVFDVTKNTNNVFIREEDYGFLLFSKNSDGVSRYDVHYKNSSGVISQRGTRFSSPAEAFSDGVDGDIGACLSLLVRRWWKQ